MVDTELTLTKRQDALLIIDDDPASQRQLARALADEAAIVTTTINNLASSLHELLTPVVVLGSSKGSALDLMKSILAYAPQTKILVVINEPNVDAIPAMESGATDVIGYPFSDELLRLKVRRAMHTAKLEQEVDRLKAYERQQLSIVGSSHAMNKVLKIIDRVAYSDVNTLICGESGTGKALFARAIHDRSERRDGPFVTVNCASISESILDADLFGVEQGSFDTRHVKIGKIEAAHGGTLFLDAVGDMPLAIQGKVLRFLQERMVDRLSGQRAIAVDVKVVAATHQDLSHRSGDRTFREDLLQLLGEVTINVPPLRERDDDILLLAKTFLMRFNQSMNRRLVGFTEDAIDAMLSYSWPGNVRELQNKVQSAVIMADGTQISAVDLALTKEHRKDSGLPLNLRQVREEAERHAVTRALARAEGNMSQTANLLGVSRPTLYTLIDKYSLQR